MKKIALIITALLLALTIAGTLPAQVFADSVPEYISEVKIGMGKKAADAEKALAGYKILSDEKGNPVDLNQNAGGGFGSKGEKVVYLGYKTTSDRSDAVTDLALMNMKGGYSVEEYEALMETQMKAQIIPFVDNFLAAINEYRDNLKSENPANRQRAEYIKAVLNKFIDDDTGKGLGDLLVNETVYEMGLKAYNALSGSAKEKTDLIRENSKAYARIPDEEKNNHADILKILAQSNGKATLMMENLIARAADTNDDTWLDRFAGVTYDDLLKSTDMLPTDAEAETAKLFDSDAKKILKGWDDFRGELLKYDEYKKLVENFNEKAVLDAYDRFENITEKSSEDEIIEAANAYTEAQGKALEMMAAAEIAGIHDVLENYEYGEGTLLDFFTKDSAEIAENISALYPLVASLSDGQRAGLDFVTMREYMIIALSEPENYKDTDLENIAETSVYDGIDRAIYEKGGVALTSDARRSGVTPGVEESESTAFSKWTVVMAAVTGAAFLAFTASAISWAAFSYKSEAANLMIARANNANEMEGLFKIVYTTDRNMKRVEKIVYFDEMYAARASVAKWLTLGFGVAMVLLALVTTWLAYEDMVDYYHVDFTPIPHYMVDKKDITAFDENGNKIVLKNQSAYYKAVECNRTEKDEMFPNLGTLADMNGDVGKQWLALYAQKSDTSAPILASSLLVKIYKNGTAADIPAGYTTGIHMFGSGSAFNLNSELYDWNKKARQIMVYYKVDNTPAKTGSAAGSTFSTGTFALTGAAGLAVGALISGLAVKSAGKKKTKETEI